MDFLALFGSEAQRAYDVMDSGIAYLVYSQSVIGAAALWIAIVLDCPAPPGFDRLFQCHIDLCGR